jgi:Acetyltransferase (GNAT) domain
LSAPSQLLPSLDRIWRTLAAELAYTVSRMQILERIPGNPIGIAFRRIDENAMALMAKHLPVPLFNSVVGLRAGHESHVEPLTTWYRDHDVKGRFEIVPGNDDAALGRELSRLGYFQSGFHTSLIMEPSRRVNSAAGIEIESVSEAAQFDEYLDAYIAGWRFKEGDRIRFKENVRGWLGQPGWSLYLARVDGRAAAAATLFIHDKVAYCADAATDPAFRGRGLHGALLARRIHDASTADVDFICSGALFLSGSHRNMERIGMRVQFVRAIWTPV